MGQGLKCTKTKLHEDKFAQGHKVAQRDKIAQDYFK